MKPTKKEQIKKIIRKQANKINIPFFNFDNAKKTVDISPSTTLKILPDLIEKEKNEETNEKFSHFLIKPTPVLPKTAKLSSITQPILFNSVKNEQKLTANYNKNTLQPKLLVNSAVNSAIKPKLLVNSAVNSAIKPKLKENNTKNSLISSILVNKQTTSLPSIEAKLEPNATSAGGFEQAKLITIKKPNATKKELVLVGERGKETINQIDNSIVPVDLIKHIKTKTNLITTTDTKPKTELKKEIKPIQIKAKDDLGTITNVLVAKHDAKSILSMVKNQSIANRIERKSDGGFELQTSAHFLGMLSKIGKATSAISKSGLGSTAKNMAKNAAGNIKSGATSIASKSSGLAGVGSQPGTSATVAVPSTASEPLPVADQPQAEEGGSGGSAGAGIASAVGGIMGGAGAALGGIASGLGAGLGAMSALNPASMIGKGIKGLLGGSDEQKPVLPIVQSNSANPTTVTTILHQYDIYRKTADDSFMLPNYRREYG